MRPGEVPSARKHRDILDRIVATTGAELSATGHPTTHFGAPCEIDWHHADPGATPYLAPEPMGPAFGY